jgi:hypothetical protein
MFVITLSLPLLQLQSCVVWRTDMARLFTVFTQWPCICIYGICVYVHTCSHTDEHTQVQTHTNILKPGIYYSCISGWKHKSLFLRSFKIFSRSEPQSCSCLTQSSLKYSYSLQSLCHFLSLFLYPILKAIDHKIS